MCWIWPGDWGCIGDFLTSELPGMDVTKILPFIYVYLRPSAAKIDR
jgi:hypothetical protein